ncbi:hypothetical protein NESM_000705300 [Novymonas esmeraldas]|uniref:Uncharacterized protein n=1 Tax=Novymonas esmeraldas TaxID=1808958 RepID=A0AAW0EXN2_9TRYP
MPPASSTPPREKELLQRKFSAAATALADLYRESSNSYEAGYRDALLFVHRYLQSSSRVTERGHTPSSAFSLCETVNARLMSQFLLDTVAARRERMAAVRGLHSLRRRRRDSADGDVGHAGEDDEGSASDDGEDGAEAPGLLQHSSAAVEVAPLRTASAVAADTTTAADVSGSSVALVVVSSTSPALSHEMEHVLHGRDTVQARLPYQPDRQRLRVERLHGDRGRSMASRHPDSAQVRVGRRS